MEGPVAGDKSVITRLSKRNSCFLLYLLPIYRFCKSFVAVVAATFEAILVYVIARPACVFSQRSKQSLFSEGEMEEMIDTSLWRPDEKIIHYLAAQLLTCSLIINKDIDLKQWVVKHMEKKYDEIFSGGNSYEFGQWADAYVEFIVNHYSEENVPEEVLDYFDDYQSHIAKALIDELDKYPSNEYIEEYQKILEKYLV